MLTATAVKNAKPAHKPKKLFDERGLYLLVNPNGSRWWRFKYRFNGKEKLLSLGVYPDVSLSEAREQRDQARKQVAAGIDPGADRKARKASGREREANSFKAVAEEWFEKFGATWADSYREKVKSRFRRDIYPGIGSRPIADLKPTELLQVIRRIEARGRLETARRALSECSQVFRYAVSTGRVESDPTRDLKGSFAVPTVRHMPAITDPRKVGALMRAIEAYEGQPASKAALRLAPLVFVRPGELRKAEWAEFDLEQATWTIPAARMKTRRKNLQDHVVPLSKQVVAILRELHGFTGHSRFVFPGARTNGRPMSENTLNASLRRMGYSKDEMTGHGFRAMARTILDEQLGFRPDIVEHQLAHAVRDPHGRAYNRTAHLPERRKMMQAWADYLDAAARDGNVVPIRKANA
jgi:integrase